MKKLNEFIDEDLQTDQMIDESFINNKDFDKVNKIISNNNNLIKFIKKHEGESEMEKFSDDDISDIVKVMTAIHEVLLFMLDEGSNQEELIEWLDDCEDEISDETGVDDDRVELTISYYKNLFNEITHKKLSD